MAALFSSTEAARIRHGKTLLALLSIVTAMGLLAGPHSAQAQDPAQALMKTLLVGVDHRTTTSLNGDWHYLVDLAPAAVLQSRLSSSDHLKAAFPITHRVLHSRVQEQLGL